MQCIKWISVWSGMGCLVYGLNLQASGIVEGNSQLNIAAMWYVVGAFILILPPAIEFKLARSQADRDFSRLLIVLEVFLTFSGLMYYWPDLATKIPIRIAASLLVTGFLKHMLNVLPEFRWRLLLNPIALIEYHWKALTGKFQSPAYAMSLGIDWLGIGYAFLGYDFGEFALLLGSIFLASSALRGYQVTRAAMPLSFALLNITYVGYSVFFIVASRCI